MRSSRRPAPAKPSAGTGLSALSVRLKTVTPILGGGTRTREVDGVDVIRVPTIRGHLRFWWRALYGHTFETSAQLYEAEKTLWGGATDEGQETGGRSRVEVRVDVETSPAALATLVEDHDPDPYADEFYALWPAKKPKASADVPDPTTAQRYRPGVEFTVGVCWPHDDEVRGVVENTIRAWVLFGGYGGRARRGLGSLTVVDGLEAAPGVSSPDLGGDLRAALSSLFGSDVLAGSPGLGDLPLLAGAGLVVGQPTDAEAAWRAALRWLKLFRQEPASGARVSGAGMPQPKRHSISNWPEPDKVRHLSHLPPGKHWAHDPTVRHNGIPVWPRAGFGLPIVGQFQTKDRMGSYWDVADPGAIEPKPYQIVWWDGQRLRDRLGSPLILKPMALANGQFVPCAIWLHRGYPAGQIGLRQGQNVPHGTRADFDVLVAPGDGVHFAPLGAAGPTVPPGLRLRTAFMGWLGAQGGTEVVA